jgi:hypothetical protein
MKTSIPSPAKTTTTQARAKSSSPSTRVSPVGYLAELAAMANRNPQVSQLRALQELASRSPQVRQLRALMANRSPRVQAQFKLRDEINDSPRVQELRALAAMMNPTQPPLAQPRLKEEEIPAQCEATPNRAGLPDQLKSGVESLSGIAMDNVNVHYNSSQPARLNALAYTQGRDVHVAPGQEQHLPHEAWHVVQQAQGRVKPTMQMKDGVSVNDDEGLEHEADTMGARALAAGSRHQDAATGVTGAKGPTTAQPKAVRQFFGERWYEHLGNDPGPNGDHLKGRWIGLPSISGWLEMEKPHPKYPAYKVYMSVETFRVWNEPDKLSQVKDPTGIFAALKSKVEEGKKDIEPLVKGVGKGYGAIRQRVTRKNVHALQEKVITLEQALGAFLKSSWTPVKLVLGILGLGVLAGGGMLLALISLPAWVVMSVEGLSFLYGTYLLYRWAKSDLLPTTIKTCLLLLNGLAMGSLVAVTLYDVIGYYTGLLATAPFRHIHFAAIPFALVIEYGIVKLLEKFQAMREAAAKPSTPTVEKPGHPSGRNKEYESILILEEEEEYKSAEEGKPDEKLFLEPV